MFDEQSVYWFGDIHRLSLSLCQGHSTTQLMQMIEYQKILPAFLTLMLVFFWEWFCDVLFYTLWREHLCTAALFVCLGCDKMKWNAVSLDYNPWVLVSIFISFFISSYHVLIISWGWSKFLFKLHSMTSMILKTSTETYRNTGWALLLMKILINITWFTLCQGSQLNHIMQLRAI